MWNLELFSDQSRSWSKWVIRMYVPHGILNWVISEMVYSDIETLNKSNGNLHAFQIHLPFSFL